LDGTDPVPEPTNPGTPGEAASTSSTPTGGSSPADRVADLGEQILAELGDARTNDTLTRWLSHYTARVISEADSARNTGDPEADALEAKARDAILDLWRSRSAWPNGWPPPRAAETTRLLAQLPALGDDIYWYQQNTLQRLQAVHHQIIAVLLDSVSAGSGADVEQMWLDKYGQHLTSDESVVLRHAAEQPRRVEELFRWSAPASRQPSLNQENDAPTEGPVELLRQLADAYHETITGLLQPSSSAETEGYSPDEAT
jgi:hypothetical protein